MKRYATAVLCLCCFFILAPGCGQTGEGDDAGTKRQPDPQQAERPEQPEPVALIGDDLGPWKPIQFGGEGEVFMKEGELNLDMGTMTGVQYTGDIKQLFGDTLENYELTLKAKRVEGLDIFLGLTFPVGEAGHVSLVLGGWGGVVNGISNLDGANASENKTTTYKEGGYDTGKWYDVRIRVTDKKIGCWLDGKQIVDVNRADYSDYDTHGMVLESKPFGLFTYETWGAYKDFKVRQLK
ncbi:MAG: family 16 glycoside hydrolase [Phycisphaeraceae bacterium]